RRRLVRWLPSSRPYRNARWPAPLDALASLVAPRSPRGSLVARSRQRAAARHLAAGLTVWCAGSFVLSLLFPSLVQPWAAARPPPWSVVRAVTGPVPVHLGALVGHPHPVAIGELPAEPAGDGEQDERDGREHDQRGGHA